MSWKKNIGEPLEVQSEMIKTAVHDVCTLLIESCKVIFKEEINKEIDEMVSFEKYMLEQQITSLKQINLQIQSNLDVLKQYSRRLGAGSVAGYIDKAHWIGKTYKFSKNCKSTIVEFTIFGHRTIVYQFKKNMKDNIKVHVDLTKERHSLLKSANNLVKDVGRILFCYADINCRLKIKWKDNVLTSIDDFKDHLEGLV